MCPAAHDAADGLPLLGEGLGGRAAAAEAAAGITHAGPCALLLLMPANPPTDAVPAEAWLPILLLLLVVVLAEALLLPALCRPCMPLLLLRLHSCSASSTFHTSSSSSCRPARTAAPTSWNPPVADGTAVCGPTPELTQLLTLVSSSGCFAAERDGVRGAPDGAAACGPPAPELTQLLTQLNCCGCFAAQRDGANGAEGRRAWADKDRRVDALLVRVAGR